MMEAIQNWVKEAEEMIRKHYEESFSSLSPSKLSLEVGKKFVRVVVTSDGGRGQRSAWAFIDMNTGDLFKCAGWKAPAKHARGNILKHKPAECCSWTGPHYLK